MYYEQEEAIACCPQPEWYAHSTSLWTEQQAPESIKIKSRKGKHAMETNSHITIRYSCNDCDKYSLPLLHPISREIAKYAYEHSYLILGKDSDYFIYKNPGYIPFPSKGGICISRMLYNA